MTLFAPESRAPRTYAETCLEIATRAEVYWRDCPDRLMTDEALRQRLMGWVLYGDVGGMGGLPDGEPYHYKADTDNLRFWAIRHGESELAASKRAPDFSGLALLNAVRELRGIWRPA